MLNINSSLRAVPSAGLKSQPVLLNFSRNASRRTVAYPPYPTKKLNNTHPKLHGSNLRYMMKQFLGPKNYKGEYHLNKYYYLPKDHEPNYVKPDLERGNALLSSPDSKDSTNTNNDRRGQITYQRKLQPFPGNKYCKTNLYISNETKGKILFALEKEEKSIQEVAFQFDINVPRIEALVKLHKIEQEWEKQNKITPQLKQMSSALYNMLPLYNQASHPENLTEIPTPAKTLKSRFLTIAESEPFGALDAAKVLGLESASETLEKLSKGHDADSEASQKGNNKVTGFYAPVLKHEKSVFRFKNAKVGEVGVRYGKSNRDNKKDRKIGYNQVGQRIYI